MKKLLIALATALCSCASLPAPEPAIPARVDPDRAKELYEAYKLVCENGTCQRDGETYEVEAFARTQLDGPRRVLARNRHIRNGVSWVFFGGSIAGAVGSALAFVQSGVDDEWRSRGFAIAGGAAASLLVGILVRAAWPEPTETFETAYNQALEVELERRVDADPELVETTARRELSAEEKECIRARASSPNPFTKFRIHRCVRR